VSNKYATYGSTYSHISVVSGHRYVNKELSVKMNKGWWVLATDFDQYISMW
jgi:hypothetical protein